MSKKRYKFEAKGRKQNKTQSKEENMENMDQIKDLSVFEEVQGDLHILQLVEAHPSLLPWLQETRIRQSAGGRSAGRRDI